VEEISAYIPAAQAAGVTTICFTDHVDNDPNDSGYGFYNADAYFADIDKARRSAGELEILAGMEFSEPHSYRTKLEQLSRLPYDFIIGSIHFWRVLNGKRSMFPSEMRDSGVPAEAAFESYWDATLDAVTCGGFDCLGHMDFPKRYYKTLIYDEGKLRVIFKQMLKNGIVLEINTSSLFKGVDEPMPCKTLLELYKSEGGKYITIASDAHSAEQLIESNITYGGTARALMHSVGLTEVTFKNRKMRAVEL
jgi:histidinol-phosphatase (PHP family)